MQLSPKARLMNPTIAITQDLPLFGLLVCRQAPGSAADPWPSPSPRPATRGSLIDKGRILCLLLLAATVAACGGGGSGSEVCQVGVSTMQFPTGCPTEGTATGTPTIGLSVTDPAGSVTTQVSPERAGTLQALVNRGGLFKPAD